MKRKSSIIEGNDETDEEIRKHVGKKIREMRNKLGQTAQRIADELGLSREAITHIETGRNNISAVSVWKLATLFNCAVADFFPSIPDGYELTDVDLHKIAQEDEKAAQWAEKLFRKRK
jgi:transcriptional regulator with XRE-family HTH domain